MATTTETRINSTQAKDAIYKSHSTQSTAEQIDDSVNLAHPSLNNFLYQINDKSRSVGIFVNSDSTGNSTDEWVYYFAEWLATNYPEYTVRYRIWNESANDYDSPISINTGTGSYFIDVWNFAVAGSPTYYVLNYEKIKTGMIDIIDTSIYTDASNQIDLCIINHGHNVWSAPGDWNDSLRHALFTENFLFTHPFSSYLWLRQNPFRDDYLNKARIESAVNWAKEKNICIANVWDKFENLNKDASLYADNIHPSTGLGTEESPSGTRLFLDAVTEQLSKKFNFNFIQNESLLNKTTYSLNKNPLLTHSSDVLPPDNYSVIGCSSVKDTSVFIDEKKAYSTKLVADGGTASYLRYTIDSSNGIEKIRGKWVTVATLIRTDDDSTSTYGRVGFFTNSNTSIDASLVPLNGSWNWRFYSIFVKPTDVYLRIQVYIDSSTSVVAGKTINLDKIIFVEGKLPYGNSI